MRDRMKIQPLDPEWAPSSGLAVATKPAAAAGGKSRLKRLFERQFPSVLRIAGDSKEKEEKKEAVEVEPSSVCLAKMVQNFLEDSSDGGRHQHARSRCNCFNGNRDDSSDDEPELDPAGQHIPNDVLKSLVACSNPVERTILAEVNRTLEKHRVKGSADASKRMVVDGLVGLGYDAAICRSTWEMTATYPAGEYEYIDVSLEGGARVLVDVEFRSEFEIARPAKAYRALVQALPAVFVGGEERLQQVVALAAEAARQSMKRKGLHIPPWRRYDYLRCKWLSAYRRVAGDAAPATETLDLGLLEEKSGESLVSPAPAWELPAVEPKPPATRGKIVAGLAAIF